MIDNKVYGLLGLCSKAGKVISGADICIENIKKRKVDIIIIAKDASNKTKENFKFLCENNKIPMYEFGEIENLSRAIGKENKAIIGIRNKNFSQEIEKKIMGVM